MSPDGLRSRTSRQLSALCCQTSPGRVTPSTLAPLMGILVRLHCWSQGMGVLLADETGLGKTVEAIGLINATQSIRKVLVVCPNTLKTNWCRELRRWSIRTARVAVQHAADGWIGKAADVVTAKYDIVHLGIWRSWMRRITSRTAKLRHNVSATLQKPHNGRLPHAHAQFRCREAET
jgi:SNF2-related domain